MVLAEIEIPQTDHIPIDQGFQIVAVVHHRPGSAGAASLHLRLYRVTGQPEILPTTEAEDSRVEPVKALAQRDSQF